MQLIIAHQQGQRETAREFMKAQQIDICAAQQEAAELKAQRQTFQGCAHIAKVSDHNRNFTLFHWVEQTLVDNEIPEAKWLQAAFGNRLLEHFYYTTA